MAGERDRRPSEFGGRPGLIQRLEDGHRLDVSEKHYLLRQPDSSPMRDDLGMIVAEELPPGLDTGEQLA